ncbi:MAG: 6-bladed beta-propeller [Algoriphagus sp.]|nr:6-bladed beta-propeller [Algoriphagus sp.]
MHKLLIILILLILFVSCGQGQQSTSQNALLTPIPVPSKKTKKLSDFVSRIEYLKLPEDAKVARVDKAQEYNSLYFFGDFELEKGISLIDSDMKLVANINKWGEGPGEYLSIVDFTINKDQKTVDVLSNHKLIRYDFQGNFLNEVKLPFFFYKIQHIQGNDYLAYIPKVSHADLQGPDSISILWVWDIGTNQTARVASPLETIKIPFFTERNNLNLQNGKLLFSTNFMDTIYTYDKDGELLEKRFFNSDRPYLPLDIIESSANLTLEQSEKYYYHQANLLEDEQFFVTRLIENGYFTNLIFSKKRNTSVIFSQVENDVDFGFDWIMPVLLTDGILMSISESSFLVSHLEKGGIPKESLFNKFAKDLTDNSPMVLTKYYLK